MTRDELLQKWAEIGRLEQSTHPPDRVHALGLLNELADELGGRALILDNGTVLYEYEGTVVVVGVVP